MRALKSRWPFVPDVMLFHSRAKCEKYIRKHFGYEPDFCDPPSAQTWYHDGTAVILMSCDLDWHDEAALLAHESYHAVLRHYAYLGEEEPGEEFVAYGLQVISKGLFVAHEKWKEKRGVLG
jgi:hypothetical protein